MNFKKPLKVQGPYVGAKNVVCHVVDRDGRNVHIRSMPISYDFHRGGYSLREVRDAKAKVLVWCDSWKRGAELLHDEVELQLNDVIRVGDRWCQVRSIGTFGAKAFHRELGEFNVGKTYPKVWVRQT